MQSKDGVSVITGAGFSKPLGGCSVADINGVIESMLQRAPDPMLWNTFHVRALNRLVNALKRRFGDRYNFEILLSAFEDSLPFRDPVPYIVPEADATIRTVATLGGYDAEALRELMDWALVEIIAKIDASMAKIDDEALTISRQFFGRLRERFSITLTDLNYDDCAELTVGAFEDGFSGGYPQIFDVRRFVSNIDDVTLLHLHGSRHLRYVEGLGFCKVEQTDATRHPVYVDTRTGGIYTSIVSGTAKLEKMTVPPFNLYLHRFMESLIRSPRVLIIGYGGSDLHLNQYLALLRRIHGDRLRMCCISNRDISLERIELRSIAAMAAGYESVVQEEEFLKSLEFDDSRVFSRGTLMLCQARYPPTHLFRIGLWNFSAVDKRGAEMLTSRELCANQRNPKTPFSSNRPSVVVYAVDEVVDQARYGTHPERHQ